jgi:hypothetical protein
VHERLRLRVDEGRPPPPNPVAQGERKQHRGPVRGEQHDEQLRPAPEQRYNRTDHEEDDAVGADPGEEDEEPVEPADAVVDDPALEVPVRRD